MNRLVFVMRIKGAVGLVQADLGLRCSHISRRHIFVCRDSMTTKKNKDITINTKYRNILQHFFKYVPGMSKNNLKYLLAKNRAESKKT